MKQDLEKVALKAAVRELMCAVETLRSICEHAEGKRKDDNEVLAHGMTFGMRVNFDNRGKISDYQMPSVHKDANALWLRLMPALSKETK